MGKFGERERKRTVGWGGPLAKALIQPRCGGQNIAPFSSPGARRWPRERPRPRVRERGERESGGRSRGYQLTTGFKWECRLLERVSQGRRRAGALQDHVLSIEYPSGSVCKVE